ncbi:hypothetical protein GFB56_12270 [Ensifer sp. T173]|uniref:Uncharacterized protein n=1 Tax=Ensifer canadensis TaxID=555315 RepID=A0AAW4FKG4_9HYPH|nr:hypothetical protein [Ensifer canadensis]MBM3091591.1 hypothetical protein [Ensifer canadensis]UBI74424.1 hypothetical protein J3R84_13085 [Ensifer canadensis]
MSDHRNSTTASAVSTGPNPGHPVNYTENWTKVRELGKQLSQILEEIGDREFAYIRPASNQFAVVFGGNPYDGTDPLLVAIEAYKAGCNAFTAMPGDFETTEAEMAAVAQTYGPPLDDLDSWSEPARSREAVVAALELIKSEHLVVGALGIALIDACIPYIQGEMI